MYASPHTMARLVAMSQAVNTEKENDPLAKARQMLLHGLLNECLAEVKTYWLNHPSNMDALELMWQVVSEIGRPEIARKLKNLAACVKDADAVAAQGGKMQKKTAKTFFEAGFALVDLGEYELALHLFERCLKDFPDDPVINYELGFSLMSLGKYTQALPCFQRAQKDSNDFDTGLNLSVCYVLTRQLDPAKNMLEMMSNSATAEDERKELAHRKTVLRRLEELTNKPELSARDWYYVLYGGVLIDPSYRIDNRNEDYTSIASTLLVLKGLMDGLRVEAEVIEYYSLKSKPLAKLISGIMDLPLDSYKGPGRPERALLVMAWAGDIIGPHRAFIEHTDRRSLFAYGLEWKDPLPLAPEIIGCMTKESALPWDEDTHLDSVEIILEKILDKARNIESDPDILRTIRDTIEYYGSRRQSILLGNPNLFPERPEYTAEIP